MSYISHSRRTRTCARPDGQESSSLDVPHPLDLIGFEIGVRRTIAEDDEGYRRRLQLRIVDWIGHLELLHQELGGASCSSMEGA